MGLLDRPDGTTLIVILAVCVVGLLALGAWTFLDWRRGHRPRWTGGSPDAAYPDESAPVSVKTTPKPAPAKKTAAKRTTTKAARRTPAKGSPQD